MKFKKSAIIVTISLLVVSLFGFAFTRPGKTNRTAIKPDVSEKEIKSYTIENWDEIEWEVFTDKDSELPSTYYDKESSKKWTKDLPPSSQALRQVKLVDGSPSDVRNRDLDKDGKPQKAPKVLGVKFHFTYPGHNEVTIRPPRTDKYKVVRNKPFLSENDFLKSKDTGKFEQPKDRDYFIYGLEMPGQVQEVSIWVCGRGNDYDLEGWFQDWKGDTHVLKFGAVNFFGWRPMKVQIPKNVPQGVESYPRNKTLVLTQFKLRSNPKTSGEQVVLFFDEVRVLTGTYDIHFDGADLNFDDDDCNSKDKKDQMLKTSQRDCKKGESPKPQ